MKDKTFILSEKALILKIYFTEALGSIFCRLFNVICSGIKTKLKGYRKQLEASVISHNSAFSTHDYPGSEFQKILFNFPPSSNNEGLNARQLKIKKGTKDD